MKLQRKTLIGIAAIVLMAAILLVAGLRHYYTEPTLDGQPLSDWVNLALDDKETVGARMVAVRVIQAHEKQAARYLMTWRNAASPELPRILSAPSVISADSSPPRLRASA